MGRLDHIMGNINTLYVASHRPNLKDLKICLVSQNDLTWLLKPGRHMIRIPPRLWSEKLHCALLPIGQPCYHVTTTGLKWNLGEYYVSIRQLKNVHELCGKLIIIFCTDDDVLHFGGMVSTSNTYDMNNKEPEVQVNTDGTLIWSMGTEVHR